MQETSIEKQPDKTPPKKDKQPTHAEKYIAALHGDGKLTRVPVQHLFAPPGEYFDFQDCGQSQMSNIPCSRPEAPRTPRFWVCDFIPAWQVFELTFVPGGGEPTTEIIPAIHVRRWKRFA